MSTAPISDDLALRIGLAARELPDMEARKLVHLLASTLGLPLTSAKLSKLRFNRFSAMLVDNDHAASERDMKKALSYLKGRGIKMVAEPMPSIAHYRDGDMPASIRVACSSASGAQIDAHFGSCPRFLIYQVSSEEIRLIDIRTVPPVADDEDKNVMRANLIHDCHVLCTKSIGGPAAAKVVRAGLHPMKVPSTSDAEVFLSHIQTVLRGTPPPWLAKVMGEGPEHRVRFQLEAAL